MGCPARTRQRSDPAAMHLVSVRGDTYDQAEVRNVPSQDLQHMSVHIPAQPDSARIVCTRKSF